MHETAGGRGQFRSIGEWLTIPGERLHKVGLPRLQISGWTWFIAGLTYAMVWLVLPIEVAKPLSMLVILSAIVLIATQLFPLWRMRRRAA